MCLITYVPAGKFIDDVVFNYAANVNDDGIGIMSVSGIEKFLGKRKTKRARHYSRALSQANVQHAIHMRWATHGKVCRELTHPFELPHGKAYLMHNGVIRETAKFAGDNSSDTSLFVRLLTEAPRAFDAKNLGFWEKVANFIGSGNTGLVFYPASNGFVFLNKSQGYEQDGLWYSNRYSLPAGKGGYGGGLYDGYSYSPKYNFPKLQQCYCTGGVYANGTMHSDACKYYRGDDKAPDDKNAPRLTDYGSTNVGADKWIEYWRERGHDVTSKYPVKEPLPSGPTLQAHKVTCIHGISPVACCHVCSVVSGD